MNTEDPKIGTEDLIARMANGLDPVAPLPSPGKRAALWLLGTALYLGLLVLAMVWMSGAAGTAARAFWASQAVAIAAGVLASIAAFVSVVPGLANRVRWWAAAAFVVWLATLVAAPAGVDWSAVGAANHEWLCAGFIVIGGAPLAVALAWMLRSGAPLSPATTAALAALAVATLANVGACVSLPHENGAVTFAWHGSVVLAVVGAAAWSGRRLFSWPKGK